MSGEQRAMIPAVSGRDDASRRPAFVSAPGEGRRLRIRAGEVVVREDGNRTAGSLGIFEQSMGPGDRGPVPHYHAQMTEMFVILEGSVTFRLDGETREAPAGSVVCVTPGTVHTFEAHPIDGARFLIMFSPPMVRVQYFEGLQDAYRSGGTFDHAALIRLMEEHDQFVVDDSELKARY